MLLLTFHQMLATALTELAISSSMANVAGGAAERMFDI
jgi:hypothetical protein